MEFASAFFGVFHYQYHRPVRGGRGIVQTAFLAKVKAFEGTYVHTADDGSAGKVPADISNGFRPVEPVVDGIGKKDAGGSGEGPQVLLRPILLQDDDSAGAALAFLQGVEPAVQRGDAAVVGGEGRGSANLFHRHKRLSGSSFFGPDGVETLHDALVGFLELFPGNPSYVALQRAYGPGMPDYMVEVIGRKARGVVEIAHAGHRHVAGGIMVRRYLLEGAVHPLVPVAPVSVVEGHLVVVQEICATAPSGAGKRRFRHHGVSFQQRLVGEEGR